MRWHNEGNSVYTSEGYTIEKQGNQWKMKSPDGIDMGKAWLFRHAKEIIERAWLNDGKQNNRD